MLNVVNNYYTVILLFFVGQTLFEKLPALSFTPGSILRIEADLVNLKLKERPTVDYLYELILGKFENHATVKRHQTKNWSESWERFIPEVLRLVFPFYCSCVLNFN